ncbi:MAG: hypothetical protein MAG471_01563 [Acidimicrobiaceae bacterium]|nr:hypothetical protein [Acidimicrobiaceae bacterium]
MFPEGGRQTGDHIVDLFDGTAYLAARTGASVVPVGISGTEEAMPTGSRFPRPARVCVAVGEPIPPPDRNAPRSVLREWTTTLTAGLQEAQNTAVSLG